MNSVTSAFPDRQLHVILDNFNTHKKNDHWLKAHPNVKFHFTPTSTSWLNQVEVWFSILQGQSLSGSFTSLKQLEQHIWPCPPATPIDNPETLKACRPRLSIDIEGRGDGHGPHHQARGRD
ncbi:transposase [Bradyrhizobium sp. i1.4.4]